MSLLERLQASLPSANARHVETDAEALLEAYSMAARPGTVALVESGMVEAISEALRGPYRLRIRYNDRQRLIEPNGLLLGAKRYLVAPQPASPTRTTRCASSGWTGSRRRRLKRSGLPRPGGSSGNPRSRGFRILSQSCPVLGRDLAVYTRGCLSGDAMEFPRYATSSAFERRAA